MISFENEILPLFRPKDIDSMKRRHIDLSSYEDVYNRADDILERLRQGDMPCDGAWPEDRIDLFASWIREGKSR